jgi:hypothetical protein
MIEGYRIFFMSSNFVVKISLTYTSMFTQVNSHNRQVPGLSIEGAIGFKNAGYDIVNLTFCLSCLKDL